MLSTPRCDFGHIIMTTPSTIMNNASCNQPKVVSEPDIQAPRGKEWQHGVVDTRVAGSVSEECHGGVPSALWLETGCDFGGVCGVIVIGFSMD